RNGFIDFLIFHGSLGPAQQMEFKDLFGEQLLEELQAWFDDCFQSDAMNDWEDFLMQIGSEEGQLSDESVASRINARLNPGGDPEPRFKVFVTAIQELHTSGNPFRGVRYIWFKGKRVCLHTHELLRRNENTRMYEPFKLPLPNDSVQEVALITLTWKNPLPQLQG
ncbi:MAG: hypothetical protein AAF533_13290, partial [Acidobacteriota bacterium]